MKTVKIGADTYKIVHKNLADCWGLVDNKKNIIYVDTSTDYANHKIYKRMTILHEAIHVIMNQVGIRQILDDAHEELMVRSLEVSLVRLVRDNKQLFKELLK